MRYAGLVVLAAGCSFRPPAATDASAGGGDDDAANDARPIDAPPPDAETPEAIGVQCFGTFINVCLNVPQQPLALPATIDTTSSMLCEPYTATPAIDACVVAGT